MRSNVIGQYVCKWNINTIYFCSEKFQKLHFERWQHIYSFLLVQPWAITTRRTLLPKTVTINKLHQFAAAAQASVEKTWLENVVKITWSWIFNAFTWTSTWKWSWIKTTSDRFSCYCHVRPCSPWLLIYKSYENQIWSFVAALVDCYGRFVWFILIVRSYGHTNKRTHTQKYLNIFLLFNAYHSSSLWATKNSFNCWRLNSNL